MLSNKYTQFQIPNLYIRFGSNTKRMPKIRSLFDLIKEAFEDKIL